jgi:hypothetical protein
MSERGHSSLSGLNATVLRATWVERLSHALMHDWHPAVPIMTLTAYFDESGTHGNSPGVVVAGFISMAGGWKSYETEFVPELTSRGIGVFHATSLRSERYKSLHEAHTKIICRNVLWGLSVSLKSSDYKTYYKAPGISRKVRLDSQYGLCFRMCLMSALHFVSLLPKDWPLTVVAELGHRNAPDATRIFADIKETLLPPHDQMLLGPLVFDTKEACVPLAASDALANWMFRIDNGVVSRPLTVFPNDLPSIQKIECTRETLEDYSLMMFQRLAIANGYGWQRFLHMVDQVLPRRGDTLQLPFNDPNLDEEAAN